MNTLFKRGLCILWFCLIGAGLEVQAENSCLRISPVYQSIYGAKTKIAFREYDTGSNTPPVLYYKQELYTMGSGFSHDGGMMTCSFSYTNKSVVDTTSDTITNTLLGYAGNTSTLGNSTDGPNEGWMAELGSTNWYGAEHGAQDAMIVYNYVAFTNDITTTVYKLWKQFPAEENISGSLLETYTLSINYPWAEVIAAANSTIISTGRQGVAFTKLTAGSSSMGAEVQSFTVSIQLPELDVTKIYILRYQEYCFGQDPITVEQYLPGEVYSGEVWSRSYPPPPAAPPVMFASIGVGNFELVDADGGCNSCGTTTLALAGSSDQKVGSVDMKFYIGGGDGKKSLGFLKVYGQTPSYLLSSPSNLVNFTWSDAVTVNTNSSGVITSVQAPLAYVRVAVSNDFKYELKYYGFDGTNYLTNTAPFVTWRIEDPDGGTNGFKKLRVTELRGAQSITNQYEWVESVSGWAFTKANLTKELKFTVEDEASVQWTYHRWIIDPVTSDVLSKSSQTYRSNAWGMALIGEVTGETNGLGVALYSYDSNGNRIAADYSSGGWERTQYNSSNWVTKVFRPFQGQTATTNESLCRVTEYGYSPITGAGDDGSIEADRARLTVEKVLGSEVSRTYTVRTTNEVRTIVCVTPGADWDDASNLVTIERRYTDGDFAGRTQSILRPDGTMIFYEYEWDMVSNLTTTMYSGAPGVAGTNIVDGVKMVTLTGAAGETISVTQIDILSNITIAQEVYSDFDNLHRPGKVTHLNGDVKAFVYACCNIESETDESGITTSYTYDALKRRTSSTRAGVSMINLYDAASRVVAVIKQGTNSTQMLVSSNVYNSAGELVWSMDAIGNETTYAQTVSSGVRTVTTTLPDLATSVQTYYRDGSAKSVNGTANHGTRYEYGVESEGGIYRSYTKQIRLNTNGSDSSEWVKTYVNALGNTYKTLYPDDATEVTYFNSKGQVWKQVDADGVITLFQYNPKGEQEYDAIDVDRNDTIDFSGNDRITRAMSYATNAHGVDVLRSETWQWQTLSANTATLISTSDRSVETKESWQFALGVTNYSIRVCFTNLAICSSTNVAWDGSWSVSVAQNGLPISMIHYDSNGVQLAQQSFGYDAYNRRVTVTDARTGTVTNTLDAKGRILTSTTPSPASGQNPQTTQVDYDNRGRLWRTIQADGGVVVKVYYDTGELKKTYGSRTYSVEYTYDYVGRMKTLKTWQDFASESGAAVTTWNYDSQRGFMTSKRYADGKGQDYEYTLTGKLAKRTWARGVETVYTYDDAGDLTGIDYSDITPDVAYTYDRLGRKVTITQGSQDVVTLIYNTAGQLAAEQHASGLLSGVTVTNAYDGLLRRTHLTVLTNGGSVYQAVYGYDAASRLLTVSDGTNNATYGYVTNSSLVAEIAFKQNSTLRMTTTKRYDLLNRLTNIASVTGSFTNAFDYFYNDANQRTKVTREDGSYWSYGYDDLGQITSGKHFWSDNSSVTGQQYDYGFDDIGNRNDAIQNSKPELRKSLYTANLLNQYTSRTVPGYADVIGSANTNATVTVNYQRAVRKGEYWHKELGLSNTVSAAYTGVTNIAVLNDESNPDIVTTNTGKLFLPQSPEQFVYDDDGNLTGDGRWTYVWDGENRLVQMETRSSVISAGTPKQKLEFTYDHISRRIQKKISDWNGSSYNPAYTNRFIYDGWNLILTSAQNLTKQTFLWGKDISEHGNNAGGIGGLVSVADTVLSRTSFASYDGNGNVVGLVETGSGIRNAEYCYGPFGEKVTLDGEMAAQNPFQFATKYADRESELLYFGYRYYDTRNGCWISRDPIGERGGINISSFANNDAINKFDALGRSVEVVTDKKTCNIKVNVAIKICVPKKYKDIDDNTVVENSPGSINLNDIKNDIENGFNQNWGKSDGFSIGKCKVKFSISVKVLKKCPLFGEAIEIVSDIDFRSYTEQGSSQGVWSVAAGEWGYAHELGHVMGLPDDYIDVYPPGSTDPTDFTSLPWPGYEGGMMAEQGGTVQDYNVIDILKGKNCPCKCK